MFYEIIGICHLCVIFFFFFRKMRVALLKWNLEKFEYLGSSASAFRQWYAISLFDLQVKKRIFPPLDKRWGIEQDCRSKWSTPWDIQVEMSNGVIEIGWERLITQITFTCSKSTTETLEKGVNYVQS